MTLSGLEGSLCTRKPISIQHPSYLLSNSFICSQNYNPFNLDGLGNVEHVGRQCGNTGRLGVEGTRVRKRRLQDNLRGKLTDGRRKRLDQTRFIFSVQTTADWKLKVQTPQRARRGETRRKHSKIN